MKADSLKSIEPPIQDRTLNLIATAAEPDVDSLVDQQTDGEFSSFRCFYNANHSKIQKILYRFGISNDLDDIVQNTFVKAWINLAKFKKESNINTWLTRIAVNEAHTYFHKTKKYVQIDVDMLSKSSGHTEFENRETVSSALQTLSLDHRMALVLSVIEGYTLDEISKLMEIPVGTVKSRLNRAKKQMLQALEKLGVSL